jgi:ketosteroid isomerase-like protein
LSKISRAMQLATVSLSFSCVAHAAPPMLNDPKDVQEIINLEHYLANLTDVEKVMPLFAANAIVADLSLPGWYEGHDSISAAFKPQFESIQTLNADIKDISVVTDGQFSCAALTVQIKGFLKNGTPLSTSFRELDALKKTDGKWRWIQQHVSYPMDAKTGRSLIDGPLPARGNLKARKISLSLIGKSSAPAKDEIRTWFDGALIAKDVDSLGPLFVSGDESIIYNEISPGELRGSIEIRNYYRPVFEDIKELNGTPASFSVDSDGILGVLISRVDITVKTKDGKSRPLSIRQSDCLRREDGKWKAFFEMASFPVDLKTGLAVTSSSN